MMIRIVATNQKMRMMNVDLCKIRVNELLQPASLDVFFNRKR